MLSLQHCVFSLMFLSILTGVSCEELTPVETEENSLEGSSVTLSYRYSKQVTGSDEFYWYRQYPGKPPEFIISHLGTGGTLKNPIPGLTIEVEDKKIHMNISTAEVSDSAVYYCAVRTGGANQNKLIFGRGTRLNIEPYQDLKPSFYKLSWENTTACLATGFSRHNKITDLEIFNKTAPAVRIHEESLYNQVAFSNEMDQQCAENNSTSEPCVDLLQPDPKVNFVTLIVLGLRLLFLKTIVFNVLLTLRLWISQ